MRSPTCLRNKVADCGLRRIWESFLMCFRIVISMIWGLLVNGILGREVDELTPISENVLTGV